ncbi:MAG: hypothetical protein A2W03_16815 [Candidatus Aminicenantes bacterium RBG_16_63_16]|nr:MAG: hypothetical protein A2W03_16815 [Candidatus Aminicenantes bacterium RBG_16_63_16]
MKKLISATAALLSALVVLVVLTSGAQTPPAKPAGPPRALLKVFLDWPGADIGFFRAEIPFVEFVPGLDEAQIKVLVTPQGPPGSETFVLVFSGLKEFQGDDNTFTHTPAPGDKPEDVRKGLAGLLKLGLMRYVAKTPAAKFVSVNFQDLVKPTAVVDKWDFWVFSLSASSFLMGETQYRDSSYYGSFSASRVTPELKIRTSVYGNLSKSWFDFGDDIYENSSHGYGFSVLVVKSLGKHWSAGAFLSVESSTYSNLKFSVSAAPALEFNVFPYSESTKKQFRVLYRIGYKGTRYNEETVYFKTAESLLQESLSFAYEVKQPWGTVSLNLAGSHYFHDFSLNRVELGGEVSFRIWRGLSFEVGGSYAKIRDQIALPRGGASYEEVLLRQRQLATGYQYSFSVGLNFTFGSTRSNIVNPRFGNGGRSISISM